MGKFVDYFKFVSPKTEITAVQDSQGIDGQYATFGSYTWYQRLVQGSATRLTRYREYDIMDNDVEITRALDTIAEEMTTKNINTGLPLDIQLMTEEGQTIDENVILTIRAALRHWCEIHSWNTRLFKVARNMIKYGDCFFKKHSPHKSWEWIPSQNVVAAIVDAEDVTAIKGFVCRTDTKHPRSAGGAPGVATPSMQTVSIGEPYETELLHNHQIVRFTLNDDMSESAPFGDSVLRSVYRAHKQKQLLEDAIVIYRIQRAPERRVFYIDVGKLPPERAKKYLETIKNEIRQKKIPSTIGGKESIDSVYNPQSMTEDFFFAQRPDGRGSKVETLPGGQGLGELGDLDYFMDKVLRGLRVPKSWMKPGNEGGIFNDGKIGAAYIEEMQFARFVERLQAPIEETLDKEFKAYLRSCNIHLEDDSIFKLKLPSPNNYEHYRRADLDSTLINNLTSVEGLPYLSKRFVLSRYLQLTDDEISQNELLLRQERNIQQSKDGSDIVKIYGGEGELGFEEEPFGGGGLGGGSPIELSPTGPEQPGPPEGGAETPLV